MLKSVLINGGESNRKLPKISTGKNLQMTQKSFIDDLIRKKAWYGMLKIDACAAAKTQNNFLMA